MQLCFFKGLNDDEKVNYAVANQPSGELKKRLVEVNILKLK